MATIIDALVVTLGIDNSQFHQGQKQNSEDLRRAKENANVTAKAIAASGQQAAEFFSKLRNQALMLFAAFTGANTLKQFAENITVADANMSRMAHNLDMSTETLSAWSSAVQRGGGSAEAATGTLQGLEDQLQQLRTTGESPLVPYFRSMGVAMLDAHRNARPLVDILKDMATWAEGKDPAMVAQRFRSMGFDQGTINTLLRGRKAVEDLIEQSNRLGVAHDADGKRAQQLQESWRALAQAATDIGRRILNDLSPPVIAIMGQMVQWAEVNKRWIDGKINEAIGWVTDKARELYTYLSGLDWDAITKAAGEWIKEAYADIQDFVRFVQANWPAIEADIKAFGAVASAVFKDIRQFVDDVKNGYVDSKRQVNEFVSFVQSHVPDFVQLGKTISEDAIKSGEALKQIYDDAKPILNDFAKKTKEIFDDVWPSIKAGFVGAFNASQDSYIHFLKYLKDSYPDFEKGVGDTVRSIKDIFSSLFDFVKAGWNAATGGFTEAFDTVRQHLPTWLGGVSAGKTTAEQDERSRQAIKYFTGQGWTEEQAAGIVGNIQQESSFDERAGAGTAHQGLAQWSAERQSDIEKHFNKPLMAMSYNEQLQAMQWELTQGKYKSVGDQLRNARTSQEAASVIDRNYEKPGNYGVEDAKRSANAVVRLQAYQSGLNSGAGAAVASRNPVSNSTNTSTSEVSVNGPITVQTQATDAKGIAASMAGAIRNSFMVSNANTGLN